MNGLSVHRENQASNSFVRSVMPYVLLLLLSSSYPFMFFAIEGHPYKVLIFLMLAFLTILLLLKVSNLRVHGLAVVIIAQIVIYLLLTLYHGDQLYLAIAFQLLGILIVFLFIINYINVEQFSGFIVGVVAVISIGGAVAFLLGLFGAIHPYAEMYNPDGSILYNYIITFSNSVVFQNEIQIIRSSGFFDEPGTLGFIIIHVMILNKISSNNRYYEWVLITCGFSTLSIAFFISVTLYLIVCSFFESNRRVLLLLFFLLVLGLIVVSIMPNEVADDFYSMTYGRMLPTDDRIIQADGRSNLIQEGLRINADSPFFGHGISVTKETAYNQASIAGPYVHSGIIGLLGIFLPYIYMFSKMTLKKTRMFHFFLLFILVLNYIQRPFLISLFTMTLILLIFLSIEKANGLRRW